MNIKNLEENYISVVTVAQNCGETIADKLTALNAALADMFKYYEVIVVDNFSTDGTAEKIKSLDFSFTVVTLPHLHNTQSALTAGIELAVGDYILEIPNIGADLDFANIADMYSASQQGHDFVFLTPTKISTRSKLFYSILNRYYKEHISEKFVSSVMALSSRRGQNKTADGGAKIVNRNVSYVMTGLKCAAVQTNAVNKNTRTLKENIGLMLDTLIYHTDYIYQLVMKTALFFLGVSLLAIVWGFVMFFIIENPTPGWASTFILIGVGFSALFGIMAAICKYLSNIIKSGTPKTYTFCSVEKRGRV